MAAFEDLLGINTHRTDAREAVACMNVTESHLNTSNICHGGFMATLALAAATSCVDESLALLSLDYRYLRPTPNGKNAKACARLIKKGSQLTAVEVSVYADESLVGLAFCEFAEPRVNTSTISGTLNARRIDPQFRHASDVADPSSLSDAELKRSLITLDNEYSEKLLESGQVTCASVRTHAKLANGDAVHPGLLCLLADNTLGLGAFSTVGKWKSAVTTSLKVNCAHSIPVGQEVSCTAHAAMRAGQILSMRGELWAGETQVGTCSGDFFIVT